MLCGLYVCESSWFLRWFFVFKQKTAYEVRISDWSSDVCSSDLAKGFGITLVVFGHAVDGLRSAGLVASGGELNDALDRKSGVKGKSVSGRVDLGGRSNIKNKK